jgi:hypothetical protein
VVPEVYVPKSHHKIRITSITPKQHKVGMNFSYNTMPILVILFEIYNWNTKSPMFVDGVTLHHI